MPAVAPSSWTLPATAPIPKRAHRGSQWRPRAAARVAVQLALDLADRPPAAPPQAPGEFPDEALRVPTAARPGLLRQFALGLGVFALVLAVAVPLALISEGLALAGAVAVGAVAVAVFARRLLIAPLVAALLAVLGAFAVAHSIHVARQDATVPIRFADLAPAAGLQAGGAPPVVAAVLPTRAEIGTTRVPIAGWAFPAALFALWAAGFAAIRAAHASARWLLRHAAARTAPLPA